MSSNHTIKLFCPLPLKYRNSTNREDDINNGYIFIGETQCILDCPSPLFTVGQWDSFYFMSIAMGTISMVAALILIITYSPIINKKFNKTSLAILSMSISIFLMSSTDGYQIWDIEKGWSKYCPDEGRYARQSDRSCFATGMLFQYGSVSSILWWSVLSFQIWLSIKKKKTSKKQMFYYFIGINMVALIFTIVPIYYNQYAYKTASIGCWLSDLKHQLAFFFLPLAVVLTFGSVFIVLILYEIYKLSDMVEKKHLMKYVRPIVLIILMCLEFYYMVIYYSYITSNESNVEKRLENYIRCLFENEIKPNSQQCHFRTLSPSAQFIFLFSYRIMGIEALIFYGFTTQTKKIWINSYISVLLKRKSSYEQQTATWTSKLSIIGKSSSTYNSNENIQLYNINNQQINNNYNNNTTNINIIHDTNNMHTNNNDTNNNDTNNNYTNNNDTNRNNTNNITNNNTNNNVTNNINDNINKIDK